MDKTRADYLAMEPKYIGKDQWEEQVENVFSEIDATTEESIRAALRASLDDLLDFKPLTLEERWLLDDL